MSSNKIRDALLEASIALSWATHNHLTSGDAEKYLKIVDDALSAPPRNCDRPECATTKSAWFLNANFHEIMSLNKVMTAADAAIAKAAGESEVK